MTNNISKNRRSFLKVSALASGGLMIGFTYGCKTEPKRPAFVEPQLDTPSTWSEISGYVSIGDNGVITIMAPNPEIGQNVKTSMPMIVAEELDCDWSQVIVKQAGLNGNFERQIAGGSQSIRYSWPGLRESGAKTRQLLVNAAAQEMDVDPTECTTAKGVVYHKATEQSKTYGEVAALAATLEAPEEVQLKNPKDFKIIGTDTRNVDGFNIAMGKPLFGIDTKKPGMKYATVVHPPAFGMKLASYDASAAKAMAGIDDVFEIDVKPEGAEQQWSDVNAFPKLVAIVGKSTWQVMKAKKSLNIQWEKDTNAESSTDHERILADLMNQPADKPARLDGDVDDAFANASQIVERTYSAPFLAHNTMEPMNFYADVSGDKAYLEGPIQTPIFLKPTVAAVCGIPADNVEIMMTRMGGGFGRRLYGHFGTEAAVISQKAGAPIQLVYTREEDMTQGTYRPAYKVTYKAGLDEDGNMVAFHIRGAGTHGSPVFANRYPAGAVDNYLAENHTKESNISTGAWRAPRSNFIATAEQSFLDEVAEAAGKDPIDFRLELFAKAKDNPVGEKNDYDPERYAGVLKLVKEKSGWGTDISGVSRGVSAYYCHNSYVAQVLDVVMEDGVPRVKQVHCAVDCGIVVNPIAAKNQIEGGIVDGIGHAMYSALTFKDGKPDQDNFHNYRLIRHAEAPDNIDVYFVDNGEDPTGLGEPSLPPIGAALANAIYQATGKRLYAQPFSTQEALLG